MEGGGAATTTEEETDGGDKTREAEAVPSHAWVSLPKLGRREVRREDTRGKERKTRGRQHQQGAKEERRRRGELGRVKAPALEQEGEERGLEGEAEG